MWQSSNKKSLGSKKSDRNRGKPVIHIKRTLARLEIVEQGLSTDNPPYCLNVRLVLNDLTPQGTEIFSSEPIVLNREISLTLVSPVSISIKGRILSCQAHNMQSHILSDQSFAYRIGVQFNLETEAEKSALETLCADLTREILYVRPSG